MSTTICVGGRCSGRREQEAKSNFPIRETDEKSICIRTSHSRPPPPKTTRAYPTSQAVRCSLLIMPNGRSDALRRLDIS